VSFANCGLPYHVGKVIPKEQSLLVASPEMFKKRFNIDIRTSHNVTSIDREHREVTVENLVSGNVYREKYDALVLSPGATPVRPALDGIDMPGIFALRNIPDMRAIIDWIKTKNAKTAVVVGGGFIGLEMTENLHILGIDVTIIEMEDQVMPLFDAEIAGFIQAHLTGKHVALALGSPVVAFKQGDANGISVILKSGKAVDTDMVILAIGVRPEIELARAAGLNIGDLGGIQVDDHMRTSDENIWAVGDAVEVKHVITNAPSLIPLAGPANRQGRIAADVIMGNPTLRPPVFRGGQATSVCGVLGMTIAATGITEKGLEKISGRHPPVPYEKIYLHPDHHAGYYPGAETLTMKLIFATEDGRILGVQAVGKEGVEKRVDVIAMAIQHHGTVFDLEEAELCYAPQYGSAKDPVNVAGMIAGNVLRGYVSVAHWQDLPSSDAFILDVREPVEFKRGHVEKAVNIPLGRLRERMAELPKEREIWIYCYVGQRSYFAARILEQYDFRVRNISGGYLMYQTIKAIGR
jgi:NADPH-dependent 2,4-dienoyl-CoA reductase/sulfur reductase-like enzyme/rhodanese-related sulfurtransferase